MWSVLWKNKSQQQRTLGTRCHGNPDVRNWMWINVLLIEWMVLFGHYLGFFSVGCCCLDFFKQKTWEEVGRCGEDVVRRAFFLDRCSLCFCFLFLAVALKVFVIFRKRDELDTEVSIAFHGSSAYPLYSTSKHALGAILDLAILLLGKVSDFVLVFGVPSMNLT